jgi:hypothetical protein
MNRYTIININRYTPYILELDKNTIYRLVGQQVYYAIDGKWANRWVEEYIGSNPPHIVYFMSYNSALNYVQFMHDVAIRRNITAPVLSTYTNSGTNVGTDAGTNAGTDAGTNAGTDVGTRPGTNVGTNVGTNAGTNAGTDVGTRPGTNVGTNVGTNAGTNAGTKLRPTAAAFVPRT